MPTEKELMLKQADAETTYQKKLIAGTNITIDPVTNTISSAGGGSTVQYTDNVPSGEAVGILAINGQSHPIHIPRLVEGSNITIVKNVTTGAYTISSTGGGEGTTKSYMGETNPDDLIGEDGDLYFKYHKIETVVPTELTLPSLPDDATVPFPITNFNTYGSFTFYYTDGNGAPHNRTVNTEDIVISDDPANTTGSNIYTWNAYLFIQATRSTNGEGLVLRVCGNCLYKLEANVIEIDLGIDKSYAKVEDTWLPSAEQVEANPEETSQTPLTKIKIDGVTYYIAAGGNAEIIPLTFAEWEALPNTKYSDNKLYLITDSFGTDTIIIPNPQGEATDTLTKLQIDETIYDFEGGSGAAAIEKTQVEYDALTPSQKENGSIYMVNGSQELDDNYSYYSAENDTIIVRVYHEGESDQKIEWFFRGWEQITGDMTVPSELTAYLPSTPQIAIYSANYPNATSTQNGWIGFYGGNIRAWTQNLANTTTGIMYGVVDIDGGADQINPYVDDPHIYVEGSNKIYYMGTEYANTNGGSGGGGSSYTETVLWSGYAMPQSAEQELSASIENFNAVVLYGAGYMDSNNVSQLNMPLFVPTSKIEYGTNSEISKGYTINSSHASVIRRPTLIFTDATHFVVVKAGNNDGTECGYSKIVGIKFGGGSGGTDVEANPQGEPTDTLNTIRIGEDIYDIEGSGGSAGEGVEIYSEDEYIVGKWIDGKKLYQKTVHLSNVAIPNGGTTFKYTDDSIEYAWVEKGIIRDGRTDTSIPSIITNLVFTQSNSARLGVGIDDVNRNYIKFYASDSFGANVNRHYYITVRYTKTVENDAPAWGGSVNNFGGFVDTNNVIDSGTYTSTFTHTATEDCWVFANLVTHQNAESQAYIDGVQVASIYSATGGAVQKDVMIPVKKGQVFTVNNSEAWSCNYAIYGVSYSSSGSGKVEYSTEEREIGTWIDGSKLYQRTFVLTNLSLSTSWVFNILGTTGINIVDFDGYYELQINGTTSIQKIKCNFYDTNNYYAKTLIDNDGEDLTAQVYTNAHSFIKGVITIQYIKAEGGE